MKITHTVCGGTAFIYAETPVHGDLIELEKATLLDGTKPDGPIPCGTCGEYVSYRALHWESQ